MENKTTDKTIRLENESGVSKQIQWAVVKSRVDSLIPYERNPRKITPEDFEKLKRSIARVGFHKPITATLDGRIIGGHVRIRALKELGIDEVYVSIPDRALTEAEFKEIMITDNTHFGEWDIEIVEQDYVGVELEEYGMDVLPKSNRQENPAITDTDGFVCLVELPDEEQQQSFFEEMQTRELPCKLLS
jgi:hypothetical protein